MNVLITMCCFALGIALERRVFAEEDGFPSHQIDSIQTFLNESFQNTNAGMVIGLLDREKSRVVNAGRIDGDPSRIVSGDTLFEIGSITKTFTTTLLLDMVRRGEVQLDDPADKYLPDHVTVPAYAGKKISLLNLATQDSGLPFSDKFTKGKWEEKY
jgi:D-alanyl-D-alanine-carboxypeptidase/D-alanyl-D-alanine-endopeptidase